MKVFILTDMEGATGVVHFNQVVKGSGDYERARKFLTNDINATIEGAVAAGASEVVVCEGHATMRNILLEELNSKAKLILGPAGHKEYCQIIGLDETFDAAIFIGFHAMAGTKKAIIPHTLSISAIHHFKVNGVEFGVPVVAVSGDDILAQEVKTMLGEKVTTLITKNTLAKSVAECYTPDYTFELIKNGVTKSLTNKTDQCIFKIQKPVAIEIGFNTRDMLDKVNLHNGMKFVGSREVLITHDNYLEAVKMAWRAIKEALITMPEWMK